MKLKKALLITTLWTALLGTGATFMVLAGFYLYLSPSLPSVESIRDYRLQTPLRIYSADKKLIAEFGDKRRHPIKYEDIPRDFINALIAAEDANFYHHNGVSIRGILRAVVQLITTGRKGSGGSTLTMQLTRHTFLSLKRTFSRKFNEILLALRIEKELSKEEILEMYVNLMFLGKHAYGIEAGAQVYYGKTISELSLAQKAMLVSVFKGPSTLNPIANPSRALIRRNYVLARMLKLDYISQKAHDLAAAEPVTASYHSSKIEVKAPYIAEMARKQAVEMFGSDAYGGGYDVYTTVRSDLQERAQSATISGLIDYDQRHGYRGPEKQLDLADAPLLSTEGTSLQVSEDLELRNYENWLETLKSIPSYGGLQAAAVSHVHEQSLTALIANGDQVTIDWENGLSTARPYISENSRGPSPKLAEEVAQVGDVVRLKKDNDGNYHLTQIPAAQASLVSLSPENGAILALVGGFDFNYSNFNRATQAKRQPGSNFKPFIYTSALESGLTAATIINDAPIVFDDKQLESTWRPENSSRKFNGPTRLRTALYRSQNLVSIRVLERIGIRRALQSLEKFGFNSDELPKDLSLALGSHVVTPLEVATGYATFANGGYRIEPHFIQSIVNAEGDIVYDAIPNTVCKECDQDQDETRDNAIANASKPINSLMDEGFFDDENPSLSLGEQAMEYDYELEDDAFALSYETKRALGILAPEDYPHAPKVIDDNVAYIIDSMLKDVVKRGTAYKAWKKFKRSDLAGKTGTTNGPTDAWFSGYHPNIVTSTWVGFDQNLPLGNREFGGTAALPIWIDFMELALKDQPTVIRPRPSGVTSVKIDPETGKRARIGDPDAIFEVFRSNLVPEVGDTPEADPWKSEENINEELF